MKNLVVIAFVLAFVGVRGDGFGDAVETANTAFILGAVMVKEKMEDGVSAQSKGETSVGFGPLQFSNKRDSSIGFRKRRDLDSAEDLNRNLREKRSPCGRGASTTTAPDRKRREIQFDETNYLFPFSPLRKKRSPEEEKGKGKRRDLDSAEDLNGNLREKRSPCGKGERTTAAPARKRRELEFDKTNYLFTFSPLRKKRSPDEEKGKGRKGKGKGRRSSTPAPERKRRDVGSAVAMELPEHEDHKPNVSPLREKPSSGLENVRNKRSPCFMKPMKAMTTAASGNRKKRDADHQGHHNATANYHTASRQRRADDNSENSEGGFAERIKGMFGKVVDVLQDFGQKIKETFTGFFTDNPPQ